MSSLTRELVFLILQFLDEEKYKEAVHSLEKESGFFFNMMYFESCVKNGEWDEVEKYLSGFTKVDDNRYSMKVFFEIRKQKYLEALDKRDHARAVEILVKDLKVFSTFNEELFKEITLLLTLSNFRENEQLSKYGDTKSARGAMFNEIKKLIEANPVFRDRLQFPSFKNSRLRTLINQSLNWQHQLCKSPRPNPDIKTLFVDHSCGGPGLASAGARTPSPVPPPSMGGHVSRVGGFPPLGSHGPFQPTSVAPTASSAGWMTNVSSAPHHTVPAGPTGFAVSNNLASMLKRPRTPTNNTEVDYQSVDFEHALKRPRPFGTSEQVNNMAASTFPVTYPGQSHAHSSYSSNDLPKTVVANLNQGSAVKSMDFHPVQQTLLLVGTNIGDIAIWEVGSRVRLLLKNFKVSNVGACSMTLQATLANEYSASVNRVVWSPDGALFGVAYSKHMVQIYSYHGGDDLRDHLEIDAHVGNVSDLAFSQSNKQLCIITCGQDKTIKVWDATTGNKKYNFEGHEAPVYSVCPHRKENIQFIFSTAIDGKIKAWLYDNLGSRVDYDAPGQSCTTMAYNADGTRLFSCGTTKDGESFLVEWNESEGAIKRIYHGLGKQCVGVVQFDVAKNHFLVVGDECQIKFWDMDNANLLTTTDAEGGLPASPCIRLNKEGILLAVSTAENGIKILANADGVRLLRSIENRTFDAARPASVNVSKGPMISTFGASSSAVGMNAGVAERSAPLTNVVEPTGDSRSLSDVKPRIPDELEKSKIWKLTEINEPSQLRSLKLPDGLLPIKIVRMIYTNSGNAILALPYNAVHKLWRWQRNEHNPSGKASTSIAPVVWQPSNGILMTNDISDTDVENSVPCFALSKNDSYVMSSSGGKISLFNMMSFKTMTTFMPPPPSATFIAFHPVDNNVVAIGMDDSSIQIYNVRVDEVTRKLKGHQKRVTGLAFSSVLNVLVSSGADAQLHVWKMGGWEKQTSKFLQIPHESKPSPLAPTRVQFHPDETHMLVVHETHIAIYKAPKLECLEQWNAGGSGCSITDAVYSSNGHTVYASFEDGSVKVFTSSTLQLKCQINPAAYLPSNSNPSFRVYPVVIAANPTQPNQFALGFSNGGVHVLEPLESENKWSTTPPVENGSGPSGIPGEGAEQKPRV